MQNDFNIVILISGRGSNMKSLVNKAKNYKIAAVISDRADAAGLEFAHEHGIPTFAFSREKYPSLKDQKKAIYDCVLKQSPSLIALAGFMQIIAPEFVAECTGRIVNIHPSLLPDLPGLHTHERAIQEKRSAHGCTVHFVDAGVDTGQVIAQAKVSVEPADTFETLAARVLEREHVLYPWVVSSIAREGITLGMLGVGYDDLARKEAEELGFIIPGSDGSPSGPYPNCA
jgi:phosphoribosylglycinamide formyltransferase 1